jgi:hypothetical protein
MVRRAAGAALLIPLIWGDRLAGSRYAKLTLGASHMEYKQFLVGGFEQQPGKWRARIRRADGKPIKITSGKKLEQFITGLDATTELDAILMAVAAIDAKSFSRLKGHEERFWRLCRHSNASALSNRSDSVRQSLGRHPTSAKGTQRPRSKVTPVSDCL